MSGAPRAESGIRACYTRTDQTISDDETCTMAVYTCSHTRKELFMDASTATGAEGRSWPQRMSAITFFVEDLELMKQFYAKVFRLPLLFEDNDAAMFKIGTTSIKLLK